jgi:protein NirF
MKAWAVLLLIASLQMPLPVLASDVRGTGDLGVVIERATGSIQVVVTSGATLLKKITGLGDLSHASIVFSRDERYAYVFGRDGGLTKIDLLEGTITKRVIQSGNSIGGAISQDGKYVAVSNYTPGGVKIFDTETLQLVADIPAVYDNDTKQSKVVGLVDAPGNQFVFSLYDGGEIWTVDMSAADHRTTRYKNVGKQPYDALITPNGRYYIAGLFGEDGLVLLDLWHPEKGVRRILEDYGRGSEKMPVYKMPHLEGWAMTEDFAFLPAVGRNQVLVVNRRDWSLVSKIPVHGQPVFVMARPDGRQVWVNFAYPNNDTVQVIDTESRNIVASLTPGKAVLHMEFTPRGEHVWVSARDDDKVIIYDTKTLEKLSELKSTKPSGIFFTDRAHKIGL